MVSVKAGAASRNSHTTMTISSRISSRTRSRTYILYLDFSKAFDKVDHKILLRKLHNIGIRGKLYDWISDFLTERKQTVKVDGKSFIPELVISGVPQGTVLRSCGRHGQVIILVLIGCFADDTRLSMALRAGLQLKKICWLFKQISTT